MDYVKSMATPIEWVGMGATEERPAENSAFAKKLMKIFCEMTGLEFIRGKGRKTYPRIGSVTGLHVYGHSLGVLNVIHEHEAEEIEYADEDDSDCS